MKKLDSRENTIYLKNRFFGGFLRENPIYFEKNCNFCIFRRQKIAVFGKNAKKGLQVLEQKTEHRAWWGFFDPFLGFLEPKLQIGGVPNPQNTAIVVQRDIFASHCRSTKKGHQGMPFLGQTITATLEQQAILGVFPKFY